MSILNTKSEVQQRSQQQIFATRYNTARHNILSVVIFTLINIILCVTNSGRYFLFSAFVPYMLTDMGMFECGLYPAEYYNENFPGMQFADTSFMVVCCVIAAVILVLYFLSWLLLKKPRVGWMIFALVFFIMDTAVMLLMVIDISDYIIDILFHGWVIISLIMGIISYFKLKKLQPEQEETVLENCDMPEQEIVE